MAGDLSFPIERAEIVALWLETMLFGMFTVLYVLCVYVLVVKRVTGSINYAMLYAASLMWALATMHLGIAFARAIEAYTTGYEGGPRAYYSVISEWKHAFKTAVYAFLTVISDSFVVYRCWVVYSRNIWVVLFPIMLVLADAITGFYSVYVLTQFAAGDAIFHKSLAPWGLAYFAVTVAANGLATGLIAFRIWRTNRAVKAYSQTNLWEVAIVMTESGAIYSLALFALIFTYSSGSNAQYIVLDAITPLIGIVFTMIIVRIGLGISRGGGASASHIGGLSTHNNGIYSTSGATSRIGNVGKTTTMNGVAGSGYPLKPIAVSVTRQMDGDSVLDYGKMGKAGESDDFDKGFDKGFERGPNAV